MSILSWRRSAAAPADPATVVDNRPAADPAAMAQRLRVPGQRRPGFDELLRADQARTWGAA